jgi:pimeloyl-ACP methyl ester carboxylesterase
VGEAPRVMRRDLGRTMLLRSTMAHPRQIPPEAATEMAATFASTPTFSEHLSQTRRERFTGGDRIDPRVPVTVAWGDKERLIPAKARLRDELPAHARVVTLAGCGHSPMWDDPELVARTTLDGAGAQARQEESLNG